MLDEHGSVGVPDGQLSASGEGQEAGPDDRITIVTIELPPALANAMNFSHDRRGKKDEHSIRGGTYVNLEDVDYKSIMKLLRRLDHHFQKLVGKKWSIRTIWTSRLLQGGYHVPHHHPGEGYTAICYVQTGPGGLLRFDEREIIPKPGMVVIFPSSLTHETTAYEGIIPRLSVTIDVFARES